VDAPTSSPSHNVAWTLVALVGVLLLAQWALWPAWYQPDRWLVGNWAHPDCLSNHWLLAWVAEQVASGGSLLHNDRYYWPVGDSPLLAGNGSEGFLYLPFHLLWGWPAAVPPYLMVVLTLNGMAGWALARTMGAGPLAALLGAAACLTWPYTIQELSSGRFSQLDASWLMFFLAAWVRFLDRPTIRWALLSAVLLAAASLFYWYYGWFGVVAGAVLAVASSMHRRRLPPLKPSLVFSLAFLILIAPWAAFFGMHWDLIPGTAEEVLFPHPQAVADSMALAWPPTVNDGRDLGKALALVPTLTGAAGVLLAMRRGTPWQTRGLVAVGAIFFLLALGPTFPGAPFTLLYGLAAPLRRFWWPVRHLVLFTPVMAGLGAWFLTRAGHNLGDRLGLGPRLRLAVALVLSVGAAISVPAWYAHSSTIHKPIILRMATEQPVYGDLAALDDGVLLQPPMAPEASGALDVLMFQRFHHKTLLTGHAMWVDRVRPDEWDSFVAANSFLRGLQFMERGQLPPSGQDQVRFAFEAQDFEALTSGGLRWLVLDRSSFTFQLQPVVHAYRQLYDELFGEPMIRGQGVWAWDVRTWTGATQAELSALNWPAEVTPAGPQERRTQVQ
jgi:hypothetical protein